MTVFRCLSGSGLFFSLSMILIPPVSEVVSLVLGIAVCRDLVRLADSRRCVAMA